MTEDLTEEVVKPWVRREIARGLQGLIALRLPGAPAEDTVGFTLDIWLAALAPRAKGWHEGPDFPRIRAAFGALFFRCRQWPVPADFIDAMPAPTLPQLLPAPKLSAEDREKGRRRIAAIIKMLSGKWSRDFSS